MALTPADVQAQQFTTVRMRTGYDMDEVDAFLDVVETEIARLLAENDDLRAQLTQAQSRVLAAEQKAARAGAPSAPPRESPSTPAPKPEPESTSEPAPTPVPVAAAAAAEIPQTPASEQALKILEIAQRTADETVAQAKKEATVMVTKAREEARAVTAGLDEQRAALEQRVAELRTFERNYRVALRDHIAGQLAEFERAAARDDSVAAEQPGQRRLDADTASGSEPAQDSGAIEAHVQAEL